MNRYLSAAYQETWAIAQHWLNPMFFDSLAAAPKKQRLPRVEGNVAVMPIYGMITQRGSIWQEIFGGTSTQGFGAAFTRAINHDQVSAVVIDVDSPGGTVAGVEELGDIIHEGAQIKPVAAVANSSANSAAYWLASQAGPGRFFAAPAADIGSIGVYRMHVDESELAAQQGVRVEFMGMPEYKTEGNPYMPLSQEAREHNMAQVQESYEAFVKAVARGRGITAGQVKANYGKGRSFHANVAADMGLVDGVKTLGEVLQAMGVGGKAQAMTTGQVSALTELCMAWENGMPEKMERQPPVSGDFELRKRKLFAMENV